MTTRDNELTRQRPVAEVVSSAPNSSVQPVASINNVDVSPQNQHPEQKSSSQSEVSPRILNRRYQLERRLGGGGMGDVYLARDLTVQQYQDSDPLLALKVLGTEVKDDPEAVIALQRECRRARSLSHPNIVRIYEFYEDEDNGAPFVTMELVRGRSLEEVIQDHPSGLPWVDAQPLVKQLCSALSYAHDEGIVHSDIKPSNLFLSESSNLKILDFGIASPIRKSVSGDKTRYDPRDRQALTPPYAPLEMWLGLSADPRDDVYSAACVIYELLSGHHPFDRLDAPNAKEQDCAVEPIATLTKAQNLALRSALAFERANRTPDMLTLLQSMTRSHGPTLPLRSISIAALIIMLMGAIWYLFAGAPQTELPSTSIETSTSTAPIPADKPDSAVVLPSPQLPSSPMPEVSREPTIPTSQTETRAPESVSMAGTCGQPNLQSLASLVQKGLALKTDLTLKGLPVETELQQVLDCLRQQHAQGMTSSDSLALEQDLRSFL